MKKFLALALIFVMALSLVACSGGTSSSAAPSGTSAGSAAGGASLANSDITVAYVCSDLGNEIFAMQVAAMEAYSKEIGINFQYQPCLDTASKISAVENYVSMGVNTVIVHVQDGPAMEACMKEAQAAGTRFFAYDTPIEGADAYYGCKNYELGYAIGSNAAAWVNETFTEGETVYAASCNYPAANFLVEREQGYKDALAELCPNVEFVIEGVGGSAANGVTAGENFLQSGKDINLVVGINDGGCLGVYEAFKTANYGGDNVGIFGCDATNDGLAAIAEGGIYRGTISTELIAVAPQFIDIAVGLANGEEGGEYYFEMIPITIDNVNEYLA